MSLHTLTLRKQMFKCSKLGSRERLSRKATPKPGLFLHLSHSKATSSARRHLFQGGNVLKVLSLPIFFFCLNISFHNRGGEGLCSAIICTSLHLGWSFEKADIPSKFLQMLLVYQFMTALLEKTSCL